MLSLRQLIRPSVLGPSLAAAAAVCGLATWYAHVRAPLPETPSIDVGSETPATDVSFHLTSSDDKAPAAPVSDALALRLTTPVEDWNYRVFASDARFPATSEDGAIAMLFEDEEDFTGAPITTLVAWSKSGKRVASFAIGGQAWKANDERILAKANAWLARATWQPLTGDATTAWSDDHSTQTIRIDAGAPLVFDGNSGTLTRRGRIVRAQFGAPGDRFMDEDSTGGPCGEVTGIERAFGTEHLVVLIPRMNLGGDSCFGSPSADVATAVALR